jgi:hypothetical protein
MYILEQIWKDTPEIGHTGYFYKWKLRALRGGGKKFPFFYTL